MQFPFSLVALCLLLITRTTKSYTVNGKRVLVTGSSGGIGRGLAIKLAEEGAEVYVHYNEREEGARQTRRLIEDRGGVCAGISQCDFSHPANIHTLFQQINGVWRDGMDILINNAGVVSKLACEDDDDYVTQWRDTMNINLNAPRLLSQLALKGMKKRGGGVIINVSSIHGEKSNEYMSAYAVSKAGLDALTRCMAIEFAEHKVRVNAIAPGVVQVERTEEHFRDPANVNPWIERLLVNQIGSVGHVAEATLPLITNDWITGTVWQVDGGMSARSNMPLRSRPQAYSPAKLPEQAAGNTEGGPAPSRGERLGDKPMPGQVGSRFPEPGYNAGRLADQPMPGQPGFGEQPPPPQPGRDPRRQAPPGYGQPERVNEPNDPRFVPMPGQQGYRDDYGRPQEGPYGRPQQEGPNYSRPQQDEPRRDDPRRPGQQPRPQRQQYGQDNGQNDFDSGGMPGQGYIPRDGGPYGGRRGQSPPSSDNDYRPLDDPNDEPPRGNFYSSRSPRSRL